MKRPEPNQQYSISLQGRQLVHTVSALRAWMRALQEKESGFESGEVEDMAIIQSVIDQIKTAIEQQTHDERTL